MDLKKWILEIIFFITLEMLRFLESTKYAIFPMKSTLSVIANRVIFLFIDVKNWVGRVINFLFLSLNSYCLTMFTSVVGEGNNKR